MSGVEAWDVSLTPVTTLGGLEFRIPIALSRSLIERGYTRAKVTLTADGILLQPYVAVRIKNQRSSSSSVEIPAEWA